MTGELTEKDYLMYYHTSIRNLGLFTTVALAILGVSRAYRGKNRLYNIVFIMITLLFQMLVFYKNYYIILTLTKMKKEIKENNYYTNEILVWSKMFFVINSIIFTFCILTLIREILY